MSRSDNLCSVCAHAERTKVIVVPQPLGQVVVLGMFCQCGHHAVVRNWDSAVVHCACPCSVCSLKFCLNHSTNKIQSFTSLVSEFTHSLRCGHRAGMHGASTLGINRFECEALMDDACYSETL